MSTFETFEHAGCTVRIEYDDSGCGNPRDDDNLGVMLCSHRRHLIGDLQAADTPYADIDDIDDLKAALIADGATQVLTVYMMDHSGLALATNRQRFATFDPHGWDWGVIGVIYDTPATRDACGTPLDRIAEVLEGEVADYDSYLQGEVYGYIVERDGETIESCWGFLGDEGLDAARSEARASAEIEQRAADLLGFYAAAH